MIEEHRTVYRISAVIVLIAAAAFLPFDRTVSFGLLLGIALYYVYLIVLTKTVTTQLEAPAGQSPLLPLGFLLRMLVLALPLFIAAKFQEHFNILAAFAPLFINHIVTFAIYATKNAGSD